MPFIDTERWFELQDDGRGARERKPAVFLDRDGVVIEERHYLKDPEDVALVPGAIATLTDLLKLDIPIVLITNQSGIGRGFFDWEAFHLVHKRMLALSGLQTVFAGAYANAHLPSTIDKDWRKPNPGMILQAASDLNICLESSVIVGDKLIDLEAGRRAGISQLVHVLSGHGSEQRSRVKEAFPDAVMLPSLAELNVVMIDGAPRIAGIYSPSQ